MQRDIHKLSWLNASAAAFSLALSAQGCADPDGRYQDFIDRTADMRGEAAGTNGGGGERFDFSGSYLLSLSTTLASGVAIFFDCQVTVAEDLQTLELSIQPLTTDMASPPREATGDSFGASDVPYVENGSFTAPLGEVTVPGDANPITGSPIVANVTITASVFPADDTLPNHFCGSATGMVISPLAVDLTGSTFGAVEATDLADTEPLLDCP